MAAHDRPADPRTITTASLDPKSQSCASQLCLRISPGGNSLKPLCTKLCTSSANCPTTTADCPGGFTCTAAFETAAMACCPMCLCKDFLPGGADPTNCKKIYPGGPPANCP